jgi:hypothetical protein
VEGASILRPVSQSALAPATSRAAGAGAPPAAWKRLLPFAAPSLLAAIAYSPALKVGFLADDFVLLAQARQWTPSVRALLPNPSSFFYRPVATWLIWGPGGQLWGSDPLPFHLISLALHAAVATFLALWVAAATGRRRLGLLTGALFAVFPLSVEAVGWAAASFDLLASAFGLAALWLFAEWRRSGGRAWYGGAILAFALAVFSKESVFLLPLALGATAWLMARARDRRWHGRLALALAPFLGVPAVNIGLRFLFWGKLGNYPFVRTDYANFYWDALWANARLLLAPVNRALLGALVAQAVGLLCSLIELGGLAVYGRPARRLLALAAVWEVAALVPVLNNGVGPDDLLQGRYLYLPATGYCLAVASLLYTAAAAPRARVAVAGLALALLAGGVALSARQLEPFQGATRVVADIDAKMHRLIPYAPRPQGMAWYVEDPPLSYQGAYVLPLGLGSTPAFARDEAFTTIVDDAQQAPLAADSRDAFAIRFGPTRRTPRYDVDYIAGITAPAEPPRATEAGTGLRVWDFRPCGAPAAEWRAEVAGVPCAPGQALALAAGRALDGPVLSVAVPRNAIRFVRIRAEVRYGAEGGGQAAHSWWWKGDQADWSATRSRALAIRADGRAHVYWTYVRADEIGRALRGLRFTADPGAGGATLAWVALDAVD